MRKIRLTALCVITSLAAFGQDDLLRWMDTIAQTKLAERDATVAKIRTPTEAEQRRQWIRAKLLEIVGGLPDFRGALNARLLGTLENPHYTVEKIVFESLPKYYVTANLYRPNRRGRYPAVLLSAGHTTLGKTENHRMAAHLAAKGFVALAYDPVGLGERVQSYDRVTRKRRAGCCADEHLHAGAQSLLIGQSVARYFIHDAMRGIDYLVSRPDVDPERIGAAGCSGGGCVTTYVAALDPRVKAAAPACFINTLKVLFRGPYPDAEMSLPRFIASGLDHADFLSVSNGIPWLVLATEGDFFTPAGVYPVYEEARRWYALEGHPERVQLFMGPGPHGTPLETREQLYAFLLRWLRPESNDARERDIKLYTDQELQVTPEGQVEFEAGSRWLYQVIRDEWLAEKQPRGAKELLAELRRLGVPSSGPPPQFTLGAQSGTRVDLTLETEPGVVIAGTLHLPQGKGRKPALVLIKDGGASEQRAIAASDKGYVALEIEPRDSPKSNDKRPFLGNWVTNLRADSIGRNLPAMRAHDIVRAVDFLQSRSDVDASRIRAAACGVDGVWLLLAGAVDERIGAIWLDGTPHSLRSALDGPIHSRLFDAVIPGFLLHWDLGDLVRAMGRRRLVWTDPTDWMVSPVRGLGAPFHYSAEGQTREGWFAQFLR